MRAFPPRNELISLLDKNLHFFPDKSFTFTYLSRIKEVFTLYSNSKQGVELDRISVKSQVTTTGETNRERETLQWEMSWLDT